MKKIIILGSTGSIGTSTLNVIRHLRGEFCVIGLGAKSKIDILESQARAFSPEMVAVFDEDKALELQKRLPGIRVRGGMQGLCELASLEGADIVVSAMVGSVGILPTLCAM